MFENRCFKKTQFEKVDLIWHLRPIRKGQNDRTLIFFLSSFLQKVDFQHQSLDLYFVFLISTPAFHENTLFHLEPSEVCFSKDYTEITILPALVLPPGWASTGEHGSSTDRARIDGRAGRIWDFPTVTPLVFAATVSKTH